MKYKKGSTFPYTEAQLKTDNPNVSFPVNPLASVDVRTNFGGIVEVVEVAQPTQQGYKVVAGEPAGDPLTETWTLTAKTLAELVPGDVVSTVPNPPTGKKPKYAADLFSTTEDPVWVDGSPYGQWQEVWAYEDFTDYKEARLDAYGSALEQIEYITENSLKEWKEKVATIKSDNPKPA
jgi:hypothetical protein